MQKRDINQATVVVTGATSGIGRAIALEFAREKANLVLAARNEDNLLEIVQECMRLGAHAISVVTDVTDPEAMQNLAAVASRAFAKSEGEGRIDVWVNNAGIGTVGDFSETPLDAHVQVVKTNLIGYMNGCHAVLPYFKEQESGVIINMNSLGAWIPLPYASGYSASKFGLLGFMEALRGEIANLSDIHVCDIYPVSVNTPGYRHAGNYVGATLKPVPPMIEADEVALAVIEVAKSPKAQTTLGWPTYLARIGYTLFPALTRNLVGQVFREYFSIAVPSPKTEGTIFQSKPEVGRSSGTPAAIGLRMHNQTATFSKPAVIGAVGLAAGLGFYLAMRSSKESKTPVLEKHEDFPLYQKLQGSQIAQR